MKLEMVLNRLFKNQFWFSEQKIIWQPWFCHMRVGIRKASRIILKVPKVVNLRYTTMFLSKFFAWHSPHMTEKWTVTPKRIAIDQINLLNLKYFLSRKTKGKWAAVKVKSLCLNICDRSLNNSSKLNFTTIEKSIYCH